MATMKIKGEGKVERKVETTIKVVHNGGSSFVLVFNAGAVDALGIKPDHVGEDGKEVDADRVVLEFRAAAGYGVVTVRKVTPKEREAGKGLKVHRHGSYDGVCKVSAGPFYREHLAPRGIGHGDRFTLVPTGKRTMTAKLGRVKANAVS